MAKKRMLVAINIELEGATGDYLEGWPAEATVIGQACDAADATMKGPVQTVKVGITGTDTMDTFKTAVLAAIDAAVGVP